ATSSPADETARLNALFEEIWQRDLARSPIRQSRMGIRAAQDRWDRVEPDRAEQDARQLQADLRRLEGFDPARLDPQAALSLRMFRFMAQARLRDLRWHR